MLYNILLLINHYVGNITINAITKTMNNIGIPHGYFIRSLGHCISIASDLLDISNPHEYADICY